MLSSSIPVIGVVSYLRVIICLDRNIQWLCGIISCSYWPCEKRVRFQSANGSTPTWLTDPSPGNRLRPTARDKALQECPCRARLRCPCNGTSNGSTRPLCQAPSRYHALVSQLTHRYSKAVLKTILGQFKCSARSARPACQPRPRHESLVVETAAFCQRNAHGIVVIPCSTCHGHTWSFVSYLISWNTHLASLASAN